MKKTIYIVLLLFIVFIANSISAEDSFDFAQELYGYGVKDYQAGKYDKAMDQFEEALGVIIVNRINNVNFIFNCLSSIRGIELKTGKQQFFKDKGNYYQYSIFYHYYAQNVITNTYKDKLYCYQKAVYYNPEEAWIYSNLGICYDMLKDYKSAEKAYFKALELEPKNKDVYYNLACSYSLQNRKKEALKYLKKAVELGYTDKKAIMKDSTLDNIKNTSEFRKILRSIK